MNSELELLASSLSTHDDHKKEPKAKFANYRIMSDQSANHRLRQKCALSKNNDVEITMDPVTSAAGPIDVTNISHVSQYSDLSMKNANLSFKFVVTNVYLM